MRHATKLMVVPYVPQIQNPTEKILNDIDEKRTEYLTNKNLNQSQRNQLYNQESIRYIQNAQKFNNSNKDYEPNFIQLLTAEIADKTYSKIKPQIDSLQSIFNKIEIKREKNDETYYPPIMENNQIISALGNIDANNTTDLSTNTVTSPKTSSDPLNNIDIEKTPTTKQSPKNTFNQAFDMQNDNTTTPKKLSKQTLDQTGYLQNLNTLPNPIDNNNMELDDTMENEDSNNQDTQVLNPNQNESVYQDAPMFETPKNIVPKNYRKNDYIQFGDLPTRFHVVNVNNRLVFLPNTTKLNDYEDLINEIPSGVTYDYVNKQLKDIKNLEALKKAYSAGSSKIANVNVLKKYIEILKQYKPQDGDGLKKLKSVKWTSKKFCY
jgi:hypothetical protein